MAGHLNSRSRKKQPILDGDLKFLSRFSSCRKETFFHNISWRQGSLSHVVQACGNWHQILQTGSSSFGQFPVRATPLEVGLMTFSPQRRRSRILPDFFYLTYLGLRGPLDKTWKKASEQRERERRWNLIWCPEIEKLSLERTISRSEIVFQHCCFFSSPSTFGKEITFPWTGKIGIRARSSIQIMPRDGGRMAETAVVVFSITRKTLIVTTANQSIFFCLHLQPTNGGEDLLLFGPPRKKTFDPHLISSYQDIPGIPRKCGSATH